MRKLISASAILAGLISAAPAAAEDLSDARGGRAITRAASTASMIAARTHFFGAENVDLDTGAVRADRVIFSWYGVTNFAAAIRGHVVLLDAWVARGAHATLVPTTPEELAALAPEAIFIGHAHFDHAADAVPIAEASGAPLVGLAEQCADLRSRSTRAMPPRCIEVLPAGAGPGAKADVKVLDDVQITVVKHLHSALKGPNSAGGGYHVPVVPLPSTAILDHPPTPADVAHLVNHAADAEGGSVLYRFRTAGRSFVWHDTAGPLLENAPGTLNVLKSLRPVDVEIGAIQGFNQFLNGLRDPRHYMEALAPAVFVPSHHDDWLVGITTEGERYRQPLEDEMAHIPAAQRPALRFIRDPFDYLRASSLTFGLKVPAARITARCLSRGRLRIGLSNPPTGTTRVRFDIGSGQRLTDSSKPFQVLFGSKRVGRAKGTRARATVRGADSTSSTLSRTRPRC